MLSDNGLQVISVGSAKRKFPFRLLAKIVYQPIDDISVYAFAELKSSS
jgi:hypothetical protein